MFSWITGPRITNAIEDLQADAGYESTFIEAPETPAHQFAVKAFKHALFGATAPEDTNTAGKKLQKKQTADLTRSDAPEIPTPTEDVPPTSPSKQPAGIMRTPITANKARKTVSFGAHVVDNEGKRANASKSGIPNDCPGKFPSPWTPGTELKVEAGSEKKPPTKLTAALLDARTTTQPRPGRKPKTRDDSDITMDFGAPRSESGKYWKEQYESYAERSEKEVKKLVAKQHLAKNYAKKKDGEVTELVTKLEQERKRYRRRQLELELQNKDYQERLRVAMSENLSASVEITALKNRIATLEKSMIAPSSEVEESKSSFQIFEDSKDALNRRIEQGNEPDVSYISQKARVTSIGKENSPPKPRPVRRQLATNTTLEPYDAYTTTPRLGIDLRQTPTILAKSPRNSVYTSEPINYTISAPHLEQPRKSQTSVRDLSLRTEDQSPKPPAAVAASSPLPQASPDPWVMGADESSPPVLDKMALPIAGCGHAGSSHGRTTRPTRPINRHRTSKSASHAVGSYPSRSVEQFEVSAASDRKPNMPKGPPRSDRASAGEQKLSSTVNPPVAVIERVPDTSATSQPKFADGSPDDAIFDVSKNTSHHAEGSSRIKQERVQLLPIDRKEEARRRLSEKNKKRLLSK